MSERVSVPQIQGEPKGLLQRLGSIELVSESSTLGQYIRRLSPRSLFGRVALGGTALFILGVTGPEWLVVPAFLGLAGRGWRDLLLNRGRPDPPLLGESSDTSTRLIALHDAIDDESDHEGDLLKAGLLAVPAGLFIETAISLAGLGYTGWALGAGLGALFTTPPPIWYAIKGLSKIWRRQKLRAELDNERDVEAIEGFDVS